MKHCRILLLPVLFLFTAADAATVQKYVVDGKTYYGEPPAGLSLDVEVKDLLGIESTSEQPVASMPWDKKTAIPKLRDEWHNETPPELIQLYQDSLRLMLSPPADQPPDDKLLFSREPDPSSH